MHPSSAQSHIAFTITFAIIAVEPGFIMVQEEPKAAYVGFGRSQEYHDAEELESAITCLEFPWTSTSVILLGVNGSESFTGEASIPSIDWI